MTKLIGYKVIPVHPGLVISDYGFHEVSVCGFQHVLDGRVRPWHQIVPSFSLQWKSDKSTKTLPHSNAACAQLTLLTGGKEFTHGYEVEGRLIQARFQPALFDLVSKSLLLCSYMYTLQVPTKKPNSFCCHCKRASSGKGEFPYSKGGYLSYHRKKIYCLATLHGISIA